MKKSIEEKISKFEKTMELIKQFPVKHIITVKPKSNWTIFPLTQTNQL